MYDSTGHSSTVDLFEEAQYEERKDICTKMIRSIVL